MVSLVESTASSLAEMESRSYWEESLEKELTSKEVRLAVKNITRSNGEIKRYITANGSTNQIKAAASAFYDISLKQKEILKKLHTLISELAVNSDFVVALGSCLSEINNGKLLHENFPSENSSVHDRYDWILEIVTLLNPLVPYIAQDVFGEQGPPESFYIVSEFWPYFITNKLVLKAVEVNYLVGRLNLLDGKVSKISTTTNVTLSPLNPYYKTGLDDYFLSQYPWIGEFAFASVLLTDFVSEMVNEIVSHVNHEEHDEFVE